MYLKRIALSLILVSTQVAFAQVIPDLTTGDSFRPYMTEEQKRDEVAKSFQAYLKFKNKLGVVPLSVSTQEKNYFAHSLVKRLLITINTF
jgi:hypothetical protein